MTVRITDIDACARMERVEQPFNNCQREDLLEAVAVAKGYFRAGNCLGDNDIIYGIHGWNRYKVEHGTGRLLFISLMRRSKTDQDRAVAEGFDVL